MIEMMFRNSRTYRWLLTATLAFSTSVAGLLPQFAGSAIPAAGPSAAESSAKTCCCGTRAGDCCGMGCCSAKEAPVPDRCPAPVHNDGVNGRISPLGLVWSQIDVPAELHGRRVWGRRGDTIDRSLADTTLQAIHVRLDA